MSTKKKFPFSWSIIGLSCKRDETGVAASQAHMVDSSTSPLTPNNIFHATSKHTCMHDWSLYMVTCIHIKLCFVPCSQQTFRCWNVQLASRAAHAYHHHHEYCRRTLTLLWISGYPKFSALVHKLGPAPFSWNSNKPPPPLSSIFSETSRKQLSC